MGWSERSNFLACPNFFLLDLEFGYKPVNEPNSLLKVGNVLIPVKVHIETRPNLTILDTACLPSPLAIDLPGPALALVLLAGEGGRRQPTPPMLRLVIMPLMLEMYDIQLLFGLLELVSEPGHLLLVGLLALLQLHLQVGQLLHGLLDALLVFVQHAVRGPVLWLQGLVYVL